MERPVWARWAWNRSGLCCCMFGCMLSSRLSDLSWPFVAISEQLAMEVPARLGLLCAAACPGRYDYMSDHMKLTQSDREE